MSNTATRLREQGYSVTSDGAIECYRKNPNHDHSRAQPDRRYLHERTAVIRLTLARDTRGGREVVERIVAAVDEPRALVGRDKRGGAVLLFRLDEQDIRPSVVGNHGGVFELALRESGELLTVSVECDGATVDVGAYSWKRSPLETPRESLAPLFADISTRACSAAFELAGPAPSPEDVAREKAFAERAAKYRADIIAGKVKLSAEEQRRFDDEILANATEDERESLFSRLVGEAQRRLRGKVAA